MVYYKGIWIVYVLFLLLGFDVTFARKVHWSQWSACTVTCGGGMTSRVRGTKIQRRPCNKKICPGVFSWPRIHFNGFASISGATNNNDRCYYDNRYFPSMSAQNMISTKIKKSHKGSAVLKKMTKFSHDPKGDNHFYFLDTKVTSVCFNASDDCKTDLLINRKVQNLHHARFFDLDVDFQTTPEIIALTVHIDGAFAANCTITQAYDYGIRVIHNAKPKGFDVEDSRMSAKFKTHLTGIKWYDPYYKRIFDDPKRLSMVFTMDFYIFASREVRITGTIGRSFHNDPQNAHAGRRLSGFGEKRNLKVAAFHFHRKLKTISMDLAKAIMSGETKSFITSDVKKYYNTIGLGIEVPEYFQDIILLLHTKHVSRKPLNSRGIQDWFLTYHKTHIPQSIMKRLLESPHKNEPFVISQWRQILVKIIFETNPTRHQIQLLKSRYRKKDYVYLLLTKPRTFNSVLFTSNEWYNKMGGFVNVDVKNLSDEYLDLIEDSKVALLNYSSKEIAFKVNYKHHNLFIISYTSCNILSKENSFGLNVQSLYGVRKRLVKGQSWPITWIVTKFGRLLSQQTKVSLLPIKKYYVQDDCRPMRYCKPISSSPTDILDISEQRRTKADGTVKIIINVTDSPGNPRMCSIDGQLYLVIIKLEYKLKSSDKLFYLRNHISPTYTLLDIGTLDYMAPVYYKTVLKQCHGDEDFIGSQIGLLVFDNLSEKVMRKTCPSWENDIRPIFQFYYNMFPVMATSGVIDLRSRESLRKNLRMLNMSMFELPWEHPNFMPVTRDLSPDKTEIVRRWIECEAKDLPETELEEERLSLFASAEEICGDETSWSNTVNHLQDLLQSAMMIEWYTIPPYLTAWFSIQEGRSKKAADILKSIYTEEMLHLALASNVLISVGGHPNLTNVLQLPNYPTYLPSHGVFQIKPGLLLTLEPFSKDLIRDVFTKLEEPAPIEVQWVIVEVGYILKKLRNIGEANGNYTKQDKQAWDRLPQTLSKSPSSHFRNLLSIGLHYTTGLLWTKLFDYATNRMRATPELRDCKSIGGYYAHVMLKLIQAESCHQLFFSKFIPLFRGNPSHQLSSYQWYARARVNGRHLFKVLGLASAIEALLTIVYEGEGSSPCGIFVNKIPSPPVHFPLHQSRHFLRNHEKSHYIKFMELVAGKELVKVQTKKPEWSDAKCLEISSKICDCSESGVCGHYCFIGSDVSVPTKSIWPMMRSPMEVLYLKKTRAKKINSVFNQVYSNLLRCLETSLNGEPRQMATCTGIMKELQVIGKKLSSTSLSDPAASTSILADWNTRGWDHKNYTGPNATPTWTFKPFMESIKGPSNDYLETIRGKHEFC